MNVPPYARMSISKREVRCTSTIWFINQEALASDTYEDDAFQGYTIHLEEAFAMDASPPYKDVHFEIRVEMYFDQLISQQRDPPSKTY